MFRSELAWLNLGAADKVVHKAVRFASGSLICWGVSLLAGGSLHQLEAIYHLIRGTMNYLCLKVVM